MADFCKQCSLEIFKEDFGDLTGLITAGEVAKGYLVPTICEECGPALVDHDGICYSAHCTKHHGTQEPGHASNDRPIPAAERR